MRYTKATLVFSFLTVALILFEGEQKVDEAKHGTGRPSIAIKNRTWCKETVVYRTYSQSFKGGADELNGLISKPDYIKRAQHRCFTLSICSVMHCTDPA
jgi:hypothetical protein